MIPRKSNQTVYFGTFSSAMRYDHFRWTALAAMQAAEEAFKLYWTWNVANSTPLVKGTCPRQVGDLGLLSLGHLLPGSRWIPANRPLGWARSATPLESALPDDLGNGLFVNRLLPLDPADDKVISLEAFVSIFGLKPIPRPLVVKTPTLR